MFNLFLVFLNFSFFNCFFCVTCLFVCMDFIKFIFLSVHFSMPFLYIGKSIKLKGSVFL